ncbi:MAG: RecX family transcriptional regulator [Gemmatimonadota bacterium]
MKITSVRRQKRRRNRVNVHVDREFRLTVAEEVAVRRGLRAGIEMDEKFIEALEAEDALWRARDAALHLLSYRQRTERELRDRLMRKGYDAETVDSCAQQLKNSGLLNDEAFARAFIRDRIRARPSGRGRLRAELRSKGVASEIAESLLDDALASGDDSELELARRAAGRFKRRKGEEAIRAKRRLYGFLSRRGFTADVIRSVSDELGLGPRA